MVIDQHTGTNGKLVVPELKHWTLYSLPTLQLRHSRGDLTFPIKNTLRYSLVTSILNVLDLRRLIYTTSSKKQIGLKNWKIKIWTYNVIHTIKYVRRVEVIMSSIQSNKCTVLTLETFNRHLSNFFRLYVRPVQASLLPVWMFCPLSC